MNIIAAIFAITFLLFLSSGILGFLFLLLAMIFEEYAFGDLCDKILQFYAVVFVASGIFCILSAIALAVTNLILYKGG